MIYKEIDSFGDIYDVVYNRIVRDFYYNEPYFERYNMNFLQKIKKMLLKYTGKDFINLFVGFDFVPFVEEIKKKVYSKVLANEVVSWLEKGYHFNVPFRPKLDLGVFLSSVFLGFDGSLTVSFLEKFLEENKKNTLSYEVVSSFASVLGDTREIVLLLELLSIKELKIIVNEAWKYYDKGKFSKLSNGRAEEILPVMKEFVDSLGPLNKNNDNITYPDYLKLTGNNDEMGRRNNLVNLMFVSWVIWRVWEWFLLVKVFEEASINLKKDENNWQKKREEWGYIFANYNEYFHAFWYDVTKFSPQYVFSRGFSGIEALGQGEFLPPFAP